MMTGAEIIVKGLENEGVELIFGYPGATIAPFYDKLTKSTIRHILVRHEQHAAHEASGYARIKGKPGVCVTTSGPGAMNLLTGLATAYVDSVPMVAVTGQVDSELLGRDVFQEVDVTGASEPFTKYNYLVKDAEDLPRVIKEAFHIASTGRPGPVLIDVPVNIQTQKVNYTDPGPVKLRGYKPTLKGHTGQIKRVCRALARAERPVICAGGGIITSAGQTDFIKLAEALNIPVVSTMMGIGAVPTAHPLYMGMLGVHGKSVANQAIADADLLILLGARVSDRAVLLPNRVNDKTEVIHIDIDPAEIGKNLSTMIPVVGDAKEILRQILDQKPERKDTGWTEQLQQKREKLHLDTSPRKTGINPKAFVNLLSLSLPDDHIYCADVGQNQIWSAANSEIRAGGRFLTSGGMGTMGYSIPAAIGAKLAAPSRTVIAVCGDGSFQMEMMELGTMRQNNLDVKMVVMTNNKLGLVKEIQRKSYKDNEIAVDLTGSPSVTGIAAAYGIPSSRLESMEGAKDAVAEMLGCKGPYLLECMVDENEPSL